MPKLDFKDIMRQLEVLVAKHPVLATAVGIGSVAGGKKVYTKLKRRRNIKRALKRDKKRHKDPQYYEVRLNQESGDITKAKRVPKFQIDDLVEVKGKIGLILDRAMQTTNGHRWLYDVRLSKWKDNVKWRDRQHPDASKMDFWVEVVEERKIKLLARIRPLDKFGKSSITKAKRVPKVRQTGSGRHRGVKGRKAPKRGRTAEDAKLGRQIAQTILGEYRGPGIRRVPRGRGPTAEYIATRGVIGGISRALETGSKEAARTLTHTYAGQLKRRMERQRRKAKTEGRVYLGEIAPRRKGEARTERKELKQKATKAAITQARRGLFSGLISSAFSAIQDKIHRYPWWRGLSIKVNPDILEEELKIRGIISGGKELQELSSMYNQAMRQGRSLSPRELDYMHEVSLRAAKKLHPPVKRRKPTSKEEQKWHREALKTSKELEAGIKTAKPKVQRRKKKITPSKKDKEQTRMLSRSILSARARKERLNYIKERSGQIHEEGQSKVDDLIEEMQERGFLPTEEIFEGIEDVHKSVMNKLKFNKGVVESALNTMLAAYMADVILLNKQINVTPVQGRMLVREDLHGKKKKRRIKKDIVEQQRVETVNDILKFDVSELKPNQGRLKGHIPEGRKKKPKRVKRRDTPRDLPLVEPVVSGRNLARGI